MIVCIYRANSRVDKGQVIAEGAGTARSGAVVYSYGERPETNYIKKNDFLNGSIESISKQLTGWGKAVNKPNAGVAPVTAVASVQYQSNSPPHV